MSRNFCFLPALDGCGIFCGRTATTTREALLGDCRVMLGICQAHADEIDAALGPAPTTPPDAPANDTGKGGAS